MIPCRVGWRQAPQLRTSARRPCFWATRISLAMRRPVDIPGSARSAYGDPPMNRFVPATMRVEISKTLNSSLSDTIVSRQNGPIMPPNRAIDVLGVFDLQRHRDARRRQPFPLFVPVRFPSEDLAISERRDGELCEHIRAHVFHERAVRDRDSLAGDQVVRLVEDVRVRVD